MRKFWPVLWPYLVVIGLFAGVIGAGFVADHLRERNRPSHQLVFFADRQMFYVWAHEYRGHWLFDDRLVLETDQGPIHLDLKEPGNGDVVERIQEMTARGILRGAR